MILSRRGRTSRKVVSLIHIGRRVPVVKAEHAMARLLSVGENFSWFSSTYSASVPRTLGSAVSDVGRYDDR